MQDITIPYQYKPRDWHVNLLMNPARFKVVVAHRKSQKTTMAINELIRRAMMTKGTYWYVAPFYNEAKKIIWQDPEMLPKYVPPAIWEKRNSTELYVPFPNGSILYVLGADKPDALRGPNPYGVILDEYDYMKPDVWHGIVQPIMTANPNAWTWFVGTYNGRRDLFKKLMYAKQNPGLWYGTVLKASESGLIPSDALNEARKTTPEAFFLQEYECEAISGAADAFRGIERVLYHGDLKPDLNRVYRLGVDLAKFQDWTVLTPFDLTTFEAGRADRFNQVDWNLQKSRIESMWYKFQRPTVVMDSTGVGDPIYDDLFNRGMKNLISYKFTEESRNQLLTNLQIKIEQGIIKIPDDPLLVDELKLFQYVLKVSATGRPKVHLETTGQHDDMVMSLALAVWDIPNHPIPEQKITRNLTTEEKENLRQFDAFRKKQVLTGSRYLRR